MPRFSWERDDIVAALGDDQCFRDLLNQEVELIYSDAGYRLVRDTAFEGGVDRVVTNYRSWLQRGDTPHLAGSDGVVAAVGMMYRLFHEHLHPVFERDASVQNTTVFSERLVEQSGRGTLAHNFCFRFLRTVAYLYFDQPIEYDDSEWGALIETTVKFFEANTDHAFEQMKTRALAGRKYNQRGRR
jgi:hypothetical protein